MQHHQHQAEMIVCLTTQQQQLQEAPVWLTLQQRQRQ
jgi:hypothetical protein